MLPAGGTNRSLRRPRLNLRAPGVRAFKQLLQRMQQAVLRDSGVAAGKMAYSYVHTDNGFSAALTAAQVQRMRRHPSVASVTLSRTITRRRAVTAAADGHKSLNLPHARTADVAAPAAAAATSAAATSAAAAAAAATPAGVSSDGEGTVIGILDSGVWPEHPSFDDTGYSSTLPAGWTGTCPTTSDFACNNKIIGGGIFRAGLESEYGGHGLHDDEWASPRDSDGHGTWCAGAAAGNSGVEVPGGGTISGVAPKARLAIYRVYWDLGSGESITTDADVFAAVDQAVADGVDVLTLSLDNTNRNLDEDDWHNEKWTYFDDVPFIGALAVGVRGVRASKLLAPRPALHPFTTSSCLCFPLTLLQAGAGVTVALAVGDDGRPYYRYLYHSHPAIDNFAPYYISVGASTVPQASLTSTSTTTAAEAGSPANITDLAASTQQGTRLPATISPAATALPIVPEWSSTGPVAVRSCTVCRPKKPRPSNIILKPDIIAPGVNILASAPGTAVGETGSFSVYYNETSVAAAHVAGVAALIIQQHPDWTPAQIMSAMMTTASSTDSSNRVIRNVYGKPATPWQMGAGHVFPARALDPGLTYDAGEQDFCNFLAGLNVTMARETFGQVRLKPVAARYLNRPSISLVNLVNKITTRRTVTSVSDTTSTYRVRIKAPKAVSIRVVPSQFTIAPGQRVSFKVKAVVKRKFWNFKYGSVTWKDDKGHSVRSVLVLHCKPTCVYFC
ncbi:unnamed protein product [Closterium sp. NIES-65]|nr:unnamed protein product [Closterium sp. NIES-65]